MSIIVLDSLENVNECICPECQTYKTGGCAKEKGETLYCARGKTSCELPDNGCICGMCPLWDKYNLSGGYFCFNGIME
jgi:hypothetical protein